MGWRVILTIEQPENRREHQADQDHGGEGEVEGDILAADGDIAGELAERQLGEPGPEQADGDDQESDQDQGAVHARLLGAPGVDAPITGDGGIFASALLF